MMQVRVTPCPSRIIMESVSPNIHQPPPKIADHRNGSVFMLRQSLTPIGSSFSRLLCKLVLSVNQSCNFLRLLGLSIARKQAIASPKPPNVQGAVRLAPNSFTLIIVNSNVNASRPVVLSGGCDAVSNTLTELATNQPKGSPKSIHLVTDSQASALVLNTCSYPMANDASAPITAPDAIVSSLIGSCHNG